MGAGQELPSWRWPPHCTRDLAAELFQKPCKLGLLTRVQPGELFAVSARQHGAGLCELFTPVIGQVEAMPTQVLRVDCPDDETLGLKILQIGRDRRLRHRKVPCQFRRVGAVFHTVENEEFLGLNAQRLDARCRRGQPNSSNRLLFTSYAGLLGFEAFNLVPELLTQPLQVVVGGRRGNTGQYEAGHKLFNLSPAAEKDIFVVEGAGHYDMYYKPEYVNPAIDRLAPFYARHLGV